MQSEMVVYDNTDLFFFRIPRVLYETDYVECLIHISKSLEKVHALNEPSLCQILNFLLRTNRT